MTIIDIILITGVKANS